MGAKGEKLRAASLAPWVQKQAENRSKSPLRGTMVALGKSVRRSIVGKYV